MSVIKRGESFHPAFRPFGSEVWVSTKTRTETESDLIEMNILEPCSERGHSALYTLGRVNCIRPFRQPEACDPRGPGRR